MPRYRNLAAVGLAVAVSACTSLQQTHLATAPETVSLAETIPVERAMVRFTGSSSADVVSVVERRTTLRRSQVVTLVGDGSGPGADRIEITVSPREPGMPAKRRDTAAVAEDLAQLLPNGVAELGDRPIDTPAGPFGWATAAGREGGLCLAAWSDTTAGGGLFALDDTATEISIRVRLCRRGAKKSDLVARLAGLRTALDDGPAQPAVQAWSISSSAWPPSQGPRP